MISRWSEFPSRNGWHLRKETHSNSEEYLYLTFSPVGRKLLVVVDDELPYFDLPEEAWGGPVELNIHTAAIELRKLVQRDPSFAGIAFLQLLRKDADRGAWKKSILEAELIGLCQMVENVQEVFVCLDHAAGADGTFTPTNGFLADPESVHRISIGLARAARREVRLQVSFLARAKVEVAGIIPGFVKSSFSPSIGVPAKVRAWLGLPDHRGDVTGVAAKDWAAMRRSVVALNERLSGPLEMYWQRHWPDGGGGEKCVPEWKFKEFEQGVSIALGTAPKDDRFRWGTDWSCPPLRALTQQCRDGRDLSKCLTLAAGTVGDLFSRWNSVGNTRIEFVFEIEELQEDYLWFNAPALCSGLVRLAESFCHEAKDRIDGHPNKPHFTADGAFGRFSISVRERLQDQILEVVVSEQLRSSADPSAVSTLLVPGADTFEALRAIERQFGVSGCNRIACSESICLAVRADIVRHGPFSVWVVRP